MNTFPRGVAAALLLCALALTMSGQQFQTPTVDGTITGGEYMHSSGNWSMTWDETYLYIGKSSSGGSTIVYLDIDPRDTPTAGTNANGQRLGNRDYANAADLVGHQPTLPFRADVRVRGGSASSLRSRDGAGGWAAEVTSTDDILTVSAGASREIRIRWAALPGLTGRPLAFRWLGYDLLPGGMDDFTFSDPMPTFNSSASTRFYFNVASTMDVSGSNPFGSDAGVSTVTTNSPTGPGSLEDALMLVQGEAIIDHHYIVFELPGSTTIQYTNEVVSNSASRWLTIDASTQAGYVSSPLVVLRGASTTNPGSVGLTLTGSHFDVRGLGFQNFHTAISITDAASARLYGNYIGTDGTTAQPNGDGIVIANCASCTIGGAGITDRNVISGNTSRAIFAESSSLVIYNNYLGTNAAGTAAVGGATGMQLQDVDGVIGGSFTGNVVAGHSGNAIYIVDAVDLEIFGNRIGVGADGTTALGNGGTGLLVAEGVQVQIGSLGAGQGNIIANNASGLVVDDNLGGGHVRGNSIFNNTTGMTTVGNAVQPVPTISSAQLEQSGDLTVVVSATSSNWSVGTQSLRFDLYDADPATPSSPQGKTYRATSPCYAGDSLTNQSWNAGAGFPANAKIVLVATSYADGACSTPGDGSSAFAAATVAAAKAVTTTTLTFSSTMPARINTNLSYTVTVNSASTPAGTVTFTANGVAIQGCTNVSLTGASGNVASCSASTTKMPDGSVVQATFSGSATHEASASSTITQYWVNRIFTGPGNFSDATKWSGGFVPLNNESIAIVGTCMFDAGANPYRYLQTYLGNTTTPGSLVFAAGNTVPFHTERIASLVAGSAIDMTAGGIFRFDEQWSTANMTFTAGSGTVQVNAPGNIGDFPGPQMPALEYNNLLVHDLATAAAGAAVIRGTFHVDSNGRAELTLWTLTLQGSTLFTGSGPLFLGPTTIPAGSSLTYSRSNHAQLTGEVVIDGTLITPLDNAAATVFLGGAHPVRGSGTVILNNGFGATSASNDFSNLEFQFISASNNSLSIPKGTYRKIVIHRERTALTGNSPVFVQTLHLGYGVLTTNANTLTVTSTAPDAVTSGGGWVNGTLTRTVTSGTYDFPMGTTSYWLPATLTFNSVSSPGTVSVSGIASEHPSLTGSGIDSTKNLNAYWRYTPGTASFISLTASVFAGPTIGIDLGANVNKFVLRARAVSSGTWHNAVPTVALNASLGELELATGEQLLDHYAVSATTSVAANTPFNVTVTAQDVLNVTAINGTRTVTMSGTNLVFDANGDGTFNDASKALTNGILTISAKATADGTTSVTATDAFTKTGTSATITVTTTGVPAALTATANSATQVSVTWNAVSGATSYEVFRATVHGSYSLLTTTGSTGILDAVSANTTYLYRVRAIGSSVSAFSSTDAATTVVFTDATLTSATAIKAAHVMELRTAVNAMRVAAGLGAATFTDASLTGVAVKAVHLTELRNALDAARAAIGLTALSYTDPTLTAGVVAKTAHVTELRGGTQ